MTIAQGNGHFFLSRIFLTRLAWVISSELNSRMYTKEASGTMRYLLIDHCFHDWRMLVKPP